MLDKADLSDSQGCRKEDSVLETRLAQRHKLFNKKSLDINLNFILGSAAEFERVFSQEKFISSQMRRAMTLELFEAILFLKYNERFRDIQLVAESLEQCRKNRTDPELHAGEMVFECNVDS